MKRRSLLKAYFMGAGRSQNFDRGYFHKYATLSNYLGKGASGNVYGPIHWNEMRLAIKQATFADGKVTEDFKKDIEIKKGIWISLEHKHLTRILSVDLSQFPKAMLIVMEFAGGGSLRKTLRSLGSENKLPIDIATDWAKQIAEGMLYLHERNIVHRDLKSSNILLMEPFDIHKKMTLKIGDFDEMKEHFNTTTMSFVGTCAYMAPEVLQRQCFSKTSDVWSFGVVIWEMLSGDIPHKGLESQTMMYKSMNGTLDKLPIQQSFPDDYKLLLNRCWESTCEKRPPFKELFSVLRGIYKTQWDPVLIESILQTRLISGLTILDKELFVVSPFSSEVDIYDLVKFHISRQWDLKQLINPSDIVSCNNNKCLYIFDSKYPRQSKEVLRVHSTGNVIMTFSTEGDVSMLSVSDEPHVICTVVNGYKLNEYSLDGQLIRETRLPLKEEFNFPSSLQAIKLTSGHFVVSSYCYFRNLLRVCIMDEKGKQLKSYDGKPGGSSFETPYCPVHLSVDGNGFVLVVDQFNHRILLLDSNLEFQREILSEEKHGLRHPSRIFLDESSSRMFVADGECDSGGRISIFQFG